MDLDFWASQVHSAKHFPAAQAARLHSEDEGIKQIEQRKAYDDICRNILYLQRSLDNLKAARVQLTNKKSSISSKSSDSSRVAYPLDCKIRGEECDRGDSKFDEDSDEDCGFSYEDSEGEDDTRTCFPCPFCYVDIEIHMLCNHLQEEHCFDVKTAVCPICAANLGKDVIGHFMVQHASSLKRRRKSHKSGFWTGSSATLGRELSSFLGTSTNLRGSSESVPDSLLSPFLCHVPLSDTEGTEQDNCSDKLAASNLTSSEPSLLHKGHEQDDIERRQRVEFVQQLIASTIF